MKATKLSFFSYLHFVLIQQTTLQTKLLQGAKNFHPVVPFQPQKDKVLLMNFTAVNTNISEDLLLNTEAFSKYINTILQQHNCVYGIGGYNEHRTIYGRSNVFDSIDKTDEPRRLHLGIDIWGTIGTPVFAPLGGVLHSYAFNDRFGDYGATIVLMHQLNGEAFHTLYGHVSIGDLSNLTVGKYISHGEVIGHFGAPHENGGWPPHLHFQIIKDMHNNWGDYPGVCRFSEREKYLHNCPDPDLILQMLQYA